MRMLPICLLCFLCAVFLAGDQLAGDQAPDRAPEPAWATRAVVTRVIDGDTLEVEIRRTLRVRLLDCWAPESKIDPRIPVDQQAEEKLRGIASRKHLAELADGQQVIVQIPMAEDGDVSKAFTLGRALGNVWLVTDQEESLSQKQVAGGFASESKPEELQ